MKVSIHTASHIDTRLAVARVRDRDRVRVRIRISYSKETVLLHDITSSSAVAEIKRSRVGQL